MNKNINLLKNYSGQTILEVSLIVAVFVLVIVSSIPSLKNSIVQVFNKTGNVLDTGNIEPVTGDVVSSHEFYSSSDWTIAQGGFTINNGVITNTKTGENRAFTKDYTGTDYSVNIDIAQLQSGSGYGVWFRTDPSASKGLNGYTFQYDPGYGSGEFIMRKWVNGNEQGPFARISAKGYNWNDPHNVKVNVVGNTFTAYIDENPVLTGKDSTYTSGTAGLRTWDSTNATFQDFTVSDLTQP